MSTYTVTIRREGKEYVARDSNGSKRAWGNADKAPATCGRELAEYLFHKCEIASVTIDGRERYGDTTVVEIEG